MDVKERERERVVGRWTGKETGATTRLIKSVRCETGLVNGTEPVKEDSSDEGIRSSSMHPGHCFTHAGVKQVWRPVHVSICTAVVWLWRDTAKHSKPTMFRSSGNSESQNIVVEPHVCIVSGSR